MRYAFQLNYIFVCHCSTYTNAYPLSTVAKTTDMSWLYWYRHKYSFSTVRLPVAVKGNKLDTEKDRGRRGNDIKFEMEVKKNSKVKRKGEGRELPPP